MMRQGQQSVARIESAVSLAQCLLAYQQSRRKNRIVEFGRGQFFALLSLVVTGYLQLCVYYPLILVSRQPLKVCEHVGKESKKLHF